MKEFEVCDARSANKVGVDGVLIGSWATTKESDHRILDAGTGCGIIALMMAQRNKVAEIYGIDVDDNAIEEAIINAERSPWSNRLHFSRINFCDLLTTIPLHGEFDLIISNPPFFESGVDPATSARMTARHSGSLSPSSLIENAPRLLSSKGRLAFICPYSFAERYEGEARKSGMILSRKCIVRGRPELSPKRVLLEFIQCNDLLSDSTMPSFEELVIEKSIGEYSEDYIRLGKPFYLKF